LARVRSLARLKAVTDELRTRAMTSRDYGIGDPLAAAAAETGQNAHLLIVDDRASSSERLSGALSQYHRVEVESDPYQAVIRAAEGAFDVAIVSLGLAGYDGLRLCSQLQSLDRTRNVAVLLIAEADERSRVLRGLDIGAGDFVLRPVDRNELVARVRTQVKRKRFGEKLRESVQVSLELAVTDALTGLHNRRYLDTHTAALFDESVLRGRSMSILLLDIDRFKSINDAYGHDAGDEVLREFATRVRAHTRGIDVVARYGGEEVVVLVPDTDLDGARLVAERIREQVELTPFPIHAGTRRVAVTVSVGVAARQVGDSRGADILRRADLALYRAKEEGRNRVAAAA
jgi:two-component system, cell cycle response regulator